jgi:hypothetical protein
MTGSSLEWASDLLFARGVRVDGAIIVRFPTLSRRRQMEMPDHGFPDPDLLHEFVQGLVAAPPYTRLHEAGPQGREYLNALGQFDKGKDRIKDLLRKHGAIALDVPALPASAAVPENASISLRERASALARKYRKATRS